MAHPPLVLRPLGALERLWLVGERLSPGFFIELVIEGEGLPDPPGGWPALVARWCRHHPTLLARLRGWLGGARFVLDGSPPPVDVVDLLGWSGLSDEPPWPVPRPVDLRRDPPVRIFLSPGAPSRLVIRAHHALVDGRGLLQLGRTLFALLRGESPPPAPPEDLTDAALSRRLGGRPRALPRRDCEVLGSLGANPARPGTTWRRIRVPAPAAPLARTLLALARAAPPTGALRFDVPVDLRRHLPVAEAARLANLTGILSLDLRSALDAADPLEEIRRRLAQAVEAGEALGAIEAARPARLLPLALLAALGRADTRAALAEGRFSSTALVSNFGRVQLAEFSGAGFQARQAFVIPPSHPGLPLFLSLLGTQSHLELVAVVPRALPGSGEAAERALRAGLSRGAG